MNATKKQSNIHPFIDAVLWAESRRKHKNLFVWHCEQTKCIKLRVNNGTHHSEIIVSAKILDNTRNWRPFMANQILYLRSRLRRHIKHQHNQEGT